MKKEKDVPKKKHAEPANSDVIIAHPSYEVYRDFMSLGFRITVIRSGKPRDENFFVIAHDEQYDITYDKTFQLADKQIIFDTRKRLLLRIDERWDMAFLLEFIEKPEPPEGLYEEIKSALKSYVEFAKEEHYGLVTVWIMATYFHRCFYAVCYLFFYGQKESGKSRILDVIQRLAFNAIKVKGISLASLGDTVDGVRGTILIDQAEMLSNAKNIDLLGIITDGYTIGGGKRRVIDLSGETRKLVEFETYSFKAFGSVKDVESDLKDRGIIISMIRSKTDFPYPYPHYKKWKCLRDKLYKLLLTKWKEVRRIYKNTEIDDISHRAKELWKPLQAMLALEKVPEDEVESIKKVFLESMEDTQSELDEREVQLFKVLLEFFGEKNKCTLTVTDIAMKIEPEVYDSSSWDMSYNPFEAKRRIKKEQKSLETWIGRKIRQMTLYTKKAGRIEGKRAYLFTRSHVEEIRSRYIRTSG